MKWLYEISHTNPLWIATAGRAAARLETGDLVKVRTRIGYFVTRAWVTEGIRPGVLGMSHHLGRWRLHEEIGRLATASALVSIDRAGPGRYRDAPGPRRAAVRERRSRQPAHLVERGRRPPEPDVPGAARPGQRHALLAPARHASRRPGPDDRYGDIVVDTAKSHEVYKEWMAMTRPAPGPGGLRRPLWFDRPLRPVPAPTRSDPPEPRPHLSASLPDR